MRSIIFAAVIAAGAIWAPAASAEPRVVIEKPEKPPGTMIEVDGIPVWMPPGADEARFKICTHKFMRHQTAMQDPANGGWPNWHIPNGEIEWLNSQNPYWGCLSDKEISKLSHKMPPGWEPKE